MPAEPQTKKRRNTRGLSSIFWRGAGGIYGGWVKQEDLNDLGVLETGDCGNGGGLNCCNLFFLAIS